MILLHHSIAYPPKGWNNYVALPKECSVQTCELAAVETSNIVSKFLTHRVVFVNAQFAFCAFVGAKALLFEHQSAKRPLRPEFQLLTESLWEMSNRWKRNGSSPGNPDGTDQASTYARNLEYLLDCCQQDSRFRFNFYDHSCQLGDPKDLTTPAQAATPSHNGATPSHDRRQSTNSRRYSNMNGAHAPRDVRHLPPTTAPNTPSLPNTVHGITVYSPTAYPNQQQSPNSVASYLGPPLRTNSFDQNQHAYAANTHTAAGPPSFNPQLRSIGANGSGNTLQDESLLSLSDAFMDSQFLGMDRVITFEDANFFLPGDGFRWQ